MVNVLIHAEQICTVLEKSDSVCESHLKSDSVGHAVSSNDNDCMILCPSKQEVVLPHSITHY